MLATASGPFAIMSVIYLLFRVDLGRPTHLEQPSFGRVATPNAHERLMQRLVLHMVAFLVGVRASGQQQTHGIRALAQTCIVQRGAWEGRAGRVGICAAVQQEPHHVQVALLRTAELGCLLPQVGDPPSVALAFNQGLLSSGSTVWRDEGNSPLLGSRKSK